MARTRKKVAPARFIGAVIFCPVTESEITIDADKLDFSGRDDDCECCGSHGSVSVEVRCACGKSHDIELNAW